MALSKTTTQTQQYLKNATSPTAVSYTCQPEVVDGVLIAGSRNTNPGIFTEGTASEEYGGANINQDSNS